ncbi:MAG: iron complex outermembrane receptor protein [Oleispira sp.]|jgi:iron complex outermembrane receptor protein
MSKYPAVSILLILISLQTANADELFYGNSEEVGDTFSSTSSKHQEELLLTPLSVSIVTAKQIQQSGITTIAEAMKLVPGVIVREQTNGQFDVHIRGLETVVRGATLTGINNFKTLIMIDNRIVYDYFTGGIFWDALPVGIEDVERIEVVRGAVSSLYGANAVTGVIHIFTKRAASNSQIKTSLTLGSKNSEILHLSADKRFESLSMRLSAVSEKRERYENSYFSFVDRDYKNVDDIELTSTNARQNNPEKAIDKQAISLMLNNDPLDYLNYDLTLFHQQSEVQKVHISTDDIPFTENISNTRGLNLKINYGNLTSRVSHHSGKQETVGFTDFIYDTKISQASTAYQFKFPKLLIQPGIDFYSITYDGSFIGGERTTQETNYMLRVEYTPDMNWRFISAFSYSDFNAPADKYLNYQLLSTYQLSFDTSLRASIQAATSSPFMAKQYLDIEFTYPDDPDDPSRRVDVKGDKEARLNKIVTYEVGMRHQLDFNNFIEVEAFHSEIKDFTNLIIQQPVMIDGQVVYKRSLENIPQVAIQQGATVNWIYDGGNWNLNTFFTWQNTEVYDQTESLFQGADTFDEYSNSTPKYYAGLNMNWKIRQHLNLNVLSNYLHEHSFELQQPQGTKNIPSALYTNITLNYQYNTKIDGFLSIKNLSDQKESQHFYTDRLEPIFFMGVDVKFGGN